MQPLRSYLGFTRSPSQLRACRTLFQSRCRFPQAPIVTSSRSFTSTARRCQQIYNAQAARSWNLVSIGLLFGVSALGLATWEVYQKDESRSDGFLKFHLESKETVSPTSSLLTLVASPGTSLVCANRQSLETKGVWSVEVAQPEMGISRMYTPLPLPNSQSVPSSCSGEQIRLLIRHNFEGEMSSYLRSLRQGSAVYVRGPYLEYEIPPHANDIVFIAGGTGISPAMQVLHALNLRERQDATNQDYSLRILWANRTRADAHGFTESNRAFRCQHLDTNLLAQLMGDADPGAIALNIKYFIDEEGSFIGDREISEACKEVSKSTLDQPWRTRNILISGPEGFVSFIAGPKSQMRGSSGQGALSGLLSNIDLRDWVVWKL